MERRLSKDCERTNVDQLNLIIIIHPKHSIRSNTVSSTMALETTVSLKKREKNQRNWTIKKSRKNGKPCTKSKPCRREGFSERRWSAWSKMDQVIRTLGRRTRVKRVKNGDTSFTFEFPVKSFSRISVPRELSCGQSCGGEKMAPVFCSIDHDGSVFLFVPLSGSGTMLASPVLYEAVADNGRQLAHCTGRFRSRSPGLPFSSLVLPTRCLH